MCKNIGRGVKMTEENEKPKICISKFMKKLRPVCILGNGLLDEDLFFFKQ